MAYSSYVIQSSTLKSIASAVRTATGKTQSFTPAQMISEIQNISFYIFPFQYMGDTSLTTYRNATARIVGYRAFRGCANLHEITLDNCEYVDLAGLEHCYNLTTVHLPKCKYIADYAFTLNTNLLSVYLDKVSQVTEIGQNTIQNASTTYYVPSSLYAAFCAAPYWSMKTSQIAST